MNKKWLWIALGVLAILYAASQIWYQEDASGQDESRTRFTQLESTVATLVSRAETEFPNAEFENDNYCYFQGRKFEPDNLACAVSYKINLGNSEPVDIYDFMVEQADIVGESTIRSEREEDFLGRFTLADETPCIFSEADDRTDENSYELDCIADAETEFYELSQ